MIDNFKSEIQCLRDGSGVQFQRWYEKGKQLTSCMGTEVKMPRVPKIQYNRSNVPADTPLLYYKRSIGIPFIDILLQQLQNRFSADNCWPVSALLSLIPSLIVKLGMPPPEQFESWHKIMRYPDGSICGPGSLTGPIYLIL